MSILDSGKNFLLDKSGLQQHFDENEVLRAAANEGIISNELYNKMGGFNFKENVPFAGDFGTGLGSFTYNVAQSVLGNQPISEIPGDVARNYMGAAVGLTKDEKDLYDSILGQRKTPFNLTNAISNMFFTPTSADADKPLPPNIDITNQLDDYYEKGEMMDNVVDAPKSGILRNIDFGKLLSIAEIFGPTNLRKALAGTRLGDTVSNLFQAGRNRSNFQYRTPGYTGQLIASDQYDPITKTNRFDRAKTLFGQSRTLMEYFQKKKAEREAKKAAKAALNRAQEEINRMGYQDYGSGGGLDPSLNDPVTGEYTGASTQDYGSGE